MADSKVITQVRRDIARIERKVVRKALRKLEDGIARAMVIDDEGKEIVEEKRADHLAKDLRKSKRHAPYYVDVLLRRTETAEKLAAAASQTAPTQLNIGTVNVVVAREYPVINIDPKE